MTNEGGIGVLRWRVAAKRLDPDAYLSDDRGDFVAGIDRRVVEISGTTLERGSAAQKSINQI